jgi:hypothetical protein
MGCIARLGCLMLLLILGVIGWITRDQWAPTRLRSRAAAVAAAGRWSPLTEAGADSTRAALARLSKPRGQVFETLSGAAVASYVFKELASSLPPTTDSIEVAVLGDRIAMRAVVPTSALGGGVLGPVAAMFGERERVELSGTLRIVKPGLAEFQVLEVKIRDFLVPTGMIPRVISQLGRAARPPGLSDTGLPLALPPFIGDIRVANGKITLYKTVN